MIKCSNRNCNNYLYKRSTSNCSKYLDIAVCDDVMIINVVSKAENNKKHNQTIYKIAGKEYFNKAEIAASFNVTKMQVNRWIKKGSTSDGDIIRKYVEVL